MILLMTGFYVDNVINYEIKLWNQIGNNFFSSFYSNESHNSTLSVAPIRPCLFAITFASGYGENCVDDLEY